MGLQDDLAAKMILQEMTFWGFEMGRRPWDFFCFPPNGSMPGLQVAQPQRQVRLLRPKGLTQLSSGRLTKLSEMKYPKDPTANTHNVQVFWGFETLVLSDFSLVSWQNRFGRRFVFMMRKCDNCTCGT